MNQPFQKPAVPRRVRPTVARPKPIAMRAAEPVPLPIPFIGLFRFVRRRPGKVAMFALLGLLLLGYLRCQYILMRGAAFLTQLASSADAGDMAARAVMPGAIRDAESIVSMSNFFLACFALIGGGWILKTWAEKHFSRK